MLRFEDIKKMIVDQGIANPCCQELVGTRATLAELGTGAMTAREARRVYGVRRVSTRNTGTSTCGFDETLNALSALLDEDRVELRHFRSNDVLVTVFVHADSGDIMGCIRVGQL